MAAQHRLDPLQFSDPVAAFTEAHAEHLRLCDAFAAFCGDPDRWNDAGAATTFHTFFSRDLPRHVGHEDSTLLPVLSRLGWVAAGDADLAIMASHHERDRRLVKGLVPELARLAEGLGPTQAAGFAARGAAFVHGYRRHIAMEEAMIVPLATGLQASERRALLAAMIPA